MKLKQLLQQANFRYILNKDQTTIDVINLKLQLPNQIQFFSKEQQIILTINAKQSTIITDEPLTAIVLKLQQILLAHVNWEEELSTTLSYKQPVQQVLAVLRQKVNNPIILFNSSLSLLGFSKAPENDWQKTLNKGYIRVSNVQATPLKAIFDSPKLINGQTYKLPNFLHSFYVRRIVLRNDDYFFLILINEVSKTFNDNIDLLTDQVDKISAAVGLHNFPYQSNNANFEGILRDLLTRPNLSYTELQNRLQFDPRQLKRPLAVLCLASSTQRKAPYGTMLTRFISIHYQDYDVYLLEENSSTQIKTLQQELTGYLQRKKINIGISDPFNELHQLNRYFKQAKQAIIFSKGLTHFGIYGHYRTKALVAHLRQDNSLSMYVNPNIKRLHQDNLKLFKALTTFLKQSGNKKLTAEILHIHRSTLDYRLNQVKERYQIDYEDVENYVYNLLSVLLV